MILLDDIISVVAPAYKKQVQQQAKCDSIESLFTIGDGFDNIFMCLLDRFHKKPEDIVHFLSSTALNQHINKKKLINMIRNNQINNELLLFLSGYFDCNLWVYYANNKMFKTYYMEENYQLYKRNVFVLFLLKDDNPQYFIGAPRVDDVTTIIREKYITIPIGIRENKVFTFGGNEDNPLYEDTTEEDRGALDFPEDPFPYAVINVKNFLRMFT